MSKIDHSLFSASQDTVSAVYGNCPECDGQMSLKHANKSSFLACNNYPSCKHTQALTNHEVTVIKVMHNSSCPSCQQALAVKKGRYGMFIGCTGFPDCQFIATKQSQQEDSQSTERHVCPQCNTGHLVKRQSKYGKHFMACDAYPSCKYIEKK